jgi:hypothetical protein
VVPVRCDASPLMGQSAPIIAQRPASHATFARSLLHGNPGPVTAHIRNQCNGRNTGIRTLPDVAKQGIGQDSDKTCSKITTALVTIESLSDAIERLGRQLLDIFETSLGDTLMS